MRLRLVFDERRADLSCLDELPLGEVDAENENLATAAVSILIQVQLSRYGQDGDSPSCPMITSVLIRARESSSSRAVPQMIHFAGDLRSDGILIIRRVRSHSSLLRNVPELQEQAGFFDVSGAWELSRCKPILNSHFELHIRTMLSVKRIATLAAFAVLALFFFMSSTAEAKGPMITNKVGYEYAMGSSTLDIANTRSTGLL